MPGGKMRPFILSLPGQNRNKLDEITKLVETKKLKPVLNKVFSLSEISKAHSLLENKAGDKNFYGKIGIEIDK